MSCRVERERRPSRPGHGMGKEEGCHGGGEGIGPQRRGHVPGLGRRRRRALFALALVFCSPILLPLICATIPLLCVVSICLRFARLWSKQRRCRDEEGAVDCLMIIGAPVKGLLLQRYLEDQLGLVRSVWDNADMEE